MNNTFFSASIWVIKNRGKHRPIQYMQVRNNKHLPIHNEKHQNGKVRLLLPVLRFEDRKRLHK